MALFIVLAGMSLAQAQDAAALQARHAALREQLASNQFQRPLYLRVDRECRRAQRRHLCADEQPYAVVGPALQGMDHWCDILILHLNVKSCRASTPKAGDTHKPEHRRKFDQPLADAYPVEFLYEVVAARPDYLQVTLERRKRAAGHQPLPHRARSGAQLDARRSFLHLSYSYAYGTAARVAMQGYLATIGRDKVGFSVVGQQSQRSSPSTSAARAAWSSATRCATTWRSKPTSARCRRRRQEQLEKRLSDWYAGVERYPAAAARTRARRLPRHEAQGSPAPADRRTVKFIRRQDGAMPRPLRRSIFTLMLACLAAGCATPGTKADCPCLTGAKPVPTARRRAG